MVIEILPEIYAFEGSHGVFNTYAYAIGGEKPLLVDTIVKGAPTALIIPALDKLGWEPNRTIITHGHADHFGGAGEILRAFPNISLAAHTADIPWIEDAERYIDEMYREFGRQAGFSYDENRLDWVKNLIGEPVIISDPLRGGETFSTGTYDVEVITAPGHSKGHIVLVDAQREYAIIGDAVLGAGFKTQAGDRPWPATYEDLEDYRQTINTVRSWNLSVLSTGHWPAFRNSEIQVFLDESEDFVDRCDRLVYQALQKSPQGMVYRDLVEFVDASLGPYPAAGLPGYNCILAHLKGLKKQGRAVSIIKNGQLHWKLDE